MLNNGTSTHILLFNMFTYDRVLVNIINYMKEFQIQQFFYLSTEVQINFKKCNHIDMSQTSTKDLLRKITKSEEESNRHFRTPGRLF
jgi:hypothetical protein